MRRIPAVTGLVVLPLLLMVPGASLYYEAGGGTGCTKCHEMNDDRTAAGVHEGISCLSCHLKHGQKTRASCVECHPKMSNCGLDVEKMDTTFRTADSKHNVHFVKCADCHLKGVPRKKENS